MKHFYFTLLAIAVLAGCGQYDAQTPRTSSPSAAQNQASKASSLAEARKGFQTKLVRRETAKEPVPEPPANLFRIVRYDSPVGKLAAYLTPDPKDGNKHPAIIWITGGDCNTIGDVWSPAPASNDQTAAAFRKAGIVMMFPSLRGGNDNPGVREGFLGEVDDVLAATDFLAGQPYVDAARIYLGGHSTGGSLVLLVAECSDRFRAVFSFGPVEDIRGYGPEYMPFSATDLREAELRAPGLWLGSIKRPTFVFEGTAQGNIESLEAMARSSTNSLVHFVRVRGATHFTLLAPTNRLLASRILRDNGPTCGIAVSEEEVQKPYRN